MVEFMCVRHKAIALHTEEPVSIVRSERGSSVCLTNGTAPTVCAYGAVDAGQMVNGCLLPSSHSRGKKVFRE